MVNVSTEYINLVHLWDKEQKEHSKQISIQISKERPWHAAFWYSLLKFNVKDFLKNGAPDKTNELFATVAFIEYLRKFNDQELILLKKYSELNVNLQKDASVDLIIIKAVTTITLVLAIFSSLMTLDKYKVVYNFLKSHFGKLVTNFPMLLDIVQIFIFPFIFGLIAFLISIIARAHYLQEAIRLDRTLEHAILLIKNDININNIKE